MSQFPWASSSLYIHLLSCLLLLDSLHPKEFVRTAPCTVGLETWSFLGLLQEDTKGRETAIFENANAQEINFLLPAVYLH